MFLILNDLKNSISLVLQVKVKRNFSNILNSDNDVKFVGYLEKNIHKTSSSSASWWAWGRMERRMKFLLCTHRVDIKFLFLNEIFLVFFLFFLFPFYFHLFFSILFLIIKSSLYIQKMRESRFIFSMTEFWLFYSNFLSSHTMIWWCWINFSSFSSSSSRFYALSSFLLIIMTNERASNIIFLSTLHFLHFTWNFGKFLRIKQSHALVFSTQ